MKCPKCVELGMKSCVYGGDVGESTLMYCAPYYDEDGKYHNHDMNSTTYRLHCSNGHRWVETVRGQCPSCDWGHDREPEITILEDIEKDKFSETITIGSYGTGLKITEAK
jgi:hypothetical protein